MRLELTRAAVELFARQGFERTTVEQIARQAGSSQRTFFRYFGAKEDVLFGDAAERLVRLRAELAAAHGTEQPLELVRAALTTNLVEFVIFDDPDLEAACVELWFSEPALRRRYSEIVLEWESAVAEFLTAELPGVDGVEIAVAATALAGVVRASLRAGSAGREGVADAASRGFELLEAGLLSGLGDHAALGR